MIFILIFCRLEINTWFVSILFGIIFAKISMNNFLNPFRIFCEAFLKKNIIKKNNKRERVRKCGEFYDSFTSERLKRMNEYYMNDVIHFVQYIHIHAILRVPSFDRRKWNFIYLHARRFGKTKMKPGMRRNKIKTTLVNN